MKHRELRVALIGTGAIAQIVHLPILTAMTGVRVEGVCDLDAAKARAIAGRLGIPRVFRNDDDVFRSDDVDGVILCSPSPQHSEQAVAALDAGKHVLVERPLALDARGAEAAVRAAEAAGRTLMVAYNNRYRPDAQGVKSFIAGGELGQIFAVRAAWSNRKVRPKRLTWRHRKATAGGVFMDLGVQALDLCLWLLDYPPVDRVCAHLHPGENLEVEDTAAVLLRLENGGTIFIEVSWALVGEHDRHGVRVLGTAGSASIEPLEVFKEVETGILNVTPQIQRGRENAYTASYREELRRFVSACQAAAPPDPPREQVQLMRIASLVGQSAEKGKELRV